MSDLVVTPVRQFKIPVTAECLSPDFVAAKSLREIELTQVWEGNRKVKLGSLFRVEGETVSHSNSISRGINARLGIST